MSSSSGFGAQTTTDEVLEGVDLDRRHFMITGATSGLGEESARALATHGAAVTMLGRDEKKLEAAQGRVAAAAPDADLRTGTVDLADLNSIREFAGDYADGGAPVDVLINNAGVMASPQLQTKDGFELQFGTNHIGHFLLANRLLPKVLEGSSPRIVVLSSGAHSFSDVDLDDPGFERTDYDPWVAYGRSKTANILFTRELAGRLDGRVLAFAVHPGIIQTELTRHMEQETLDDLWDRVKDRMKTVEQGAATQVWAATAPELETASGSYLANCRVGVPGDPTENEGVKEYAYDAETAKRLWTLSEEMVGESFGEPA
ncbi:MAG: SDR family NAD(P)-dependent oxidoreductase [Solirubrobacterales bacterium]